MGNHNSLIGTKELEFYVQVFLRSYGDVATASDIPRAEYLRDCVVIRKRAESEGIGFLTKTLPALGKAIDTALSTGTVLEPIGFRRKGVKQGGQVPKLFGILIEAVFSSSGRERSDASPSALGYLRSLLFMFYKLELPTTEKSANEVIDKFKEVERRMAKSLPDMLRSGASHGRNNLEVRSAEPGSHIEHGESHVQRVQFRRDFDQRGLHCDAGPIQRDTASRIAAASVWCLHHICREVYHNNGTSVVLLPCRHGPGAVATGERGHEKSTFGRWYRDLGLVFPYEEYFFFNANAFASHLSDFLAFEPMESGTAKVVLVPKDSRGPRLISCEPLEYQWIQQGLSRTLIKAIEEHEFTRGHVNFRDQSVNQRLALEGSAGGPWVTLDMKEASDRVSLALVEELFPSHVVRLLKASRSTATRLPSGEILPLKKYAPMGSALCFPVESLIFWALSVATILCTSRPYKSLKQALAAVYVYGDDLILRMEDHHAIMQYLPLFGLMFNEQKCCTSGSFRESCGMDAYKGVCVTPLRIRKRWDRHLASTNYVSWVAYCNAFRARGLETAADFIESSIQKVRPTPHVECGSGLVGFVNNAKIPREMNKSFKRRWNERFHRSEILAYKVAPVSYSETGVPGYYEMLRIASLQREPLQSGPDSVVERKAPFYGEDQSDQAEFVRAYRYTLPRSVRIKRGWGME